jgi:hypothetical protein
MWEARKQLIPSGVRYEIFDGASQLSFSDVFALLEKSPAFARWYSKALVSSSFAAFFWEHPPLNVERFDDNAEFVLIESDSLAALEPDPGAFEQKFSGQSADVIAFHNLSGDALLVVPRPLGRIEAYPHLAAFLRSASDQQVLALWKTTAQALRETLSPQPTWLSTAGLGVPWLHLRLDSRPKYYNYRPYRSALET